jgi:molybdopterin-guanine dinucleotide biosynthesis adapter protein
MNGLLERPPVLGFAACSGSGKTTLITALLPMLAQRGIRVGVIKHSHHDFEIDQPGKDSYRLRKAGAVQMLIASPYRSALIEENAAPREPDLSELLTRLDRDTLDLILVEGFRQVAFPKIEVHRAATGKSFLHPRDPSIIAIVSDAPVTASLPRLDLNRPQDIVAFIINFIAADHSGNTP